MGQPRHWHQIDKDRVEHIPDEGPPERLTITAPGLNDPDAFAMRLIGESMTPEYHAGDILIFSPKRKAEDGDDALIELVDGQSSFRRVFFEPEVQGGKDLVRLQPRNVTMQPQLVNAVQIARIVPAVWHYRRLKP